MAHPVTALDRNPFRLLGATVRDNRQRIIELAEERLLELDHEECTKARSDLLSPRVRLGSEMSWFPGVAPRRAANLAELVVRDPTAARLEQGLPPLARANLLAASLEIIGSAEAVRELGMRIVETATAVARIAPSDVLRDINEDRTIAHLPLISSEELIEQELLERGRYYRAVLRAALDRLTATELVAAVTNAVEMATRSGVEHAPQLIDDLVGMFEVEAQQFLTAEAENIAALVGAVRAAAPLGESALVSLVDKLCAVTRNWDRVAQPIQLSARARGVEHAPSRQVAFAIRSVAVDLFNNHGMFATARRLTELLQDVFAELPELSERLKEDVEALDEIGATRAEAKIERARKDREITYTAEIGALFKDTLSISPEGVSWKRQHFTLPSVTRVRWGALSRSVNGIPTGTTYTIAFGDASSEAVVETRREDVFTSFVDRLWKAVGVRLLTEYLQELRAGNVWQVGGITVRDDGVTLTKHNFWSKEPAIRNWDSIRIGSANGAFNIVAKDGSAISASLSYIHTPNAHVLEHAVRMAFRQPGLQRLSELLEL